MTTSDIDFDAMLKSFDMFDPETGQHRWELFDHARRTCPVAHTDGGHIVVTRFQDVREVLEDPATYSSTGVAPEPSPVSLNPLDADPPYQTDLRKLLNPLFSRTYLLRYEQQMRDYANDIIDRFIDKGEFEMIMDFAAPFVGAALARIVFDEDDPDKMAAGIDITTRIAAEGTPETYFELAMFANGYLVDRKENGSANEDVLWAITTGTVLDGRKLTDEEQLGVVTVLFLAGLDTTRGAIGSIAHLITQNPELEQRIRDPKWQRRDMDEFIRLVSPVASLGRRVMCDTTLNGVSLKEGDHLMVRFDSANRDETQFVDADTLRFDVPRPGHAGFGLGIHRCLGAHFARIQIAIAYEELFKRITNLRQTDPDQTVPYVMGIARGPEELHVSFDTA